MSEKQERSAHIPSAAWQKIRLLRQVIIFGLVGVMNTAVDFFTFLLLTQVFSIYFAFAQVISYSAGMLNSYLFNSKITFSASGKSKTRLVKFIVLNVAVLLLTLIIMHSLLSLPLIIDKLISTFVGLVVNFLLSKYWVFKS
ncbi:GtrA family protein [Sporolactobacillus spathodeae]|uniref:Flippase GtrA n=1 Tax=Sporolactobacillus spathodeae TaxID=1465502 RepID=A0ABS2Q545_9BACL|nr:GtrA family protein [Sporolactobacillus spathodeae]MBM7656726.1 putative flippase GtrA [Sporolactobacillus spathodeae]